MNFKAILKSSWRVNEAHARQPWWQYPPEQTSQPDIKHLQRQNLKDKAFIWHLCREGGVRFKRVKHSVMKKSICLLSSAWQLLSWALVSSASDSQARQRGVTVLVGRVCSGKSSLCFVIVCLMLSTKLTTGKNNSVSVHVTTNMRSAHSAKQL